MKSWHERGMHATPSRNLVVVQRICFHTGIPKRWCSMLVVQHVFLSVADCAGQRHFMDQPEATVLHSIHNC